MNITNLYKYIMQLKLKKFFSIANCSEYLQAFFFMLYSTMLRERKIEREKKSSMSYIVKVFVSSKTKVCNCNLHSVR